MKGKAVQIRRLFASIVMGIGAWVLPFGLAQASTVLYSGAGFIQGAQSFVQSFDITTPGTITVTLSNIPWLDTISGLNCFLTTASRPLGPSLDVGTQSMSVGTQSISVAPGMIYAHWFGDANGTYGLGVYGMKITFQPSGSIVALPDSLILLLSGLGVLLGWQRRPDPADAAEAAI